MTEKPDDEIPMNFACEEFTKERLIELHGMLGQLEGVLAFNRMGGHDVADTMASIADIQQVVEDLTNAMP